MTPTADAKPQLRALTGVRFLAAIYVVMFHVAIVMHIVADELPDMTGPFKDWCVEGASLFNQTWYARGLMETGYVAVSFFFALSGFILTYTCLDDGNTVRVDRREFWAARFARVYPVYFFGLLVSVPGLLVWLFAQKPPVPGPKATAIAASALFLVQAWWPLASNVWNAPGWSLSVEAFFYLTFPWLAPRIDRLSRRGLWAFLALCWGISLGIPAVYVAIDPDHLSRIIWTTDAPWLKAVKFNPLVRLPEFLFGIGLGKLFGQHAASMSLGNGRRGAWLSALAFVLILAVLSVSEFLPHPVMHNGLLLPLFGLLIYGLADGGGPLAWLLSRRPAVLLGDASYAMYILHYSIIFVVIAYAWLGLGGFESLELENAKNQATAQAAESDGQAGLATVAIPATTDASDQRTAHTQKKEFPWGPDNVPSPLGFFFLCAGITIVSSIVVHKLIEVPSRRILRRLLSRRRTSPPAQTLPDLP